MKKRSLIGAAILAVTSYVGLTNKHIVKGIFQLEKPQGDLFTRVTNHGALMYLTKNNAHAEELFKDWVAYHGWKKVDQVGEGWFFVNGEEETLLLNRELILGGRYILWRATRAIEN